MKGSTHRERVLGAYRELLRLVRRLPEGQRGPAAEEARSGLRAHAAEADEAQRLELLKRLVGRVAFLRSVTPRRPGGGPREGPGGGGHYVLREGKLVEGHGRSGGARVADGVLSHEEARQRHASLLQRQHFGRAPPAYDPSTF